MNRVELVMNFRIGPGVAGMSSSGLKDGKGVKLGKGEHAGLRLLVTSVALARRGGVELRGKGFGSGEADHCWLLW